MQKDFGFSEKDVIYVHDGTAAVNAFKQNLKQLNKPDYAPIRLILTD